MIQNTISVSMTGFHCAPAFSGAPDEAAAPREEAREEPREAVLREAVPLPDEAADRPAEAADRPAEVPDERAAEELRAAALLPDPDPFFAEVLRLRVPDAPERAVPVGFLTDLAAMFSPCLNSLPADAARFRASPCGDLLPLSPAVLSYPAHGSPVLRQ